MIKKTPLYAAHLKLGGKMVPFADWEMPISYGSQLDEHHAVRQAAGMFDVSHMTLVEFKGAGTHDFLSYLLANDINKLKDGRGLYSCMLNEQGGVVDDLICYREHADHYYMIVNAATHDKDLAWFNQHAKGHDTVITEIEDQAIIAIQGPKALEMLAKAVPEEIYKLLKNMRFFDFRTQKGWFIAKTGYTGESGFEIMLPEKSAQDFWDALLKAGIAPCGLGARDTLRLEAGLSLYGQDLSEDHSPLASGLSWTVNLERDGDFIGKDALIKENASGPKTALIGLELCERGIPRAGQRVYFSEAGEGVVTSGSFSPTLEYGIALARVEAGYRGTPTIEIRSKRLEARHVKLPFVKKKSAD